MALDEVHGKSAVTEWQVLEKFPQGITWLNLGLKTGRTHQIRVHLSAQGWPVVGDPLYGGTRPVSPKTRGPLAEALKAVSRQLLHSCRLIFSHPTNGNTLDFRSPLPKDMEDLIRHLSPFQDTNFKIVTKR
jgi:23S rRNA pseudouridine1911/1915/1917 synthase